MKHRFKLSFETDEPDLSIPDFQRALPSNFSVEKERDGIYLYLRIDSKSKNQIQYLVDRELDRHFFLTCAKIKAERITPRICASLTIKYRIHGSLPPNIKPQQWTYELAIQLRLWSVAVDSDDLLAKVILFFQIIELSQPQYPQYTNALSPPHPLTECRLLRNLVVHAGNVDAKELRVYCEYLKMPELMLDPTDSRYVALVKNKLPLLESQAQKVIAAAISS